jgi:hypothetical protein
MPIISTEAMTYKEYLKKGEIISVKIRIIKSRVYHKHSIQDIADHFSMHRNSIGNIMRIYHIHASDIFKRKIESNASFSSRELEEL